MRETIIDYIKRTKDETIEMSPFNEVDSLILAQFSYLKFDGMVPGLENRDAAVTLEDIRKSPSYDGLYADERYRKDNTALFEAMYDSRRFNRIKLHSYVNIIEYENETQFAALVIEFENGFTYVAFRGTDENLISWKEDLNLALSKPVPGQIRSAEYLDQVSGYIAPEFVTGGHSKGGNLAVFSAMYCKSEVCSRIQVIYNHDGPGMRPELIDDERYHEIKDRVRMSVPEASLVGMLMVNLDSYKVVESKKIDLLQHDPYGWLVDGYEFKTAETVAEVPALRGKSINEWVLSMSEEQIELFINTLCEVVAASGAKTLNDIKDNWPDIIKNMLQALKEVDDETKEAMTSILELLMIQIENNAKSAMNKKMDGLLEQAEEFANAAKECRDKIEETAEEGREYIVSKINEIKSGMKNKSSD